MFSTCQRVKFDPGLGKGPGFSVRVGKTRVLKTWVENFRAGSPGPLPSPGLTYSYISLTLTRSEGIFESF